MKLSKISMPHKVATQSVAFSYFPEPEDDPAVGTTTNGTGCPSTLTVSRDLGPSPPQDPHHPEFRTHKSAQRIQREIAMTPMQIPTIINVSLLITGVLSGLFRFK